MMAYNSNTMRNSSLHLLLFISMELRMVLLLYAIISCLAAYTVLVSLILVNEMFFYTYTFCCTSMTRE